MEKPSCKLTLCSSRQVTQQLQEEELKSQKQAKELGGYGLVEGSRTLNPKFEAFSRICE